MPQPHHRTETVQDLARHGGRLAVLCLDCGHEGRVIPFDLIARFGMERRLDSLHFRCRCCGADRVQRETRTGHGFGTASAGRFRPRPH